MAVTKTFKGFPKEGLKFLKDLKNNNNRDWFGAHKKDYEEYLLEPAQNFVSDLGNRLKSLSKGIIYDTRTNGSGSIMRIYRDVRFSKDKSPYNTYLRMMFWEGEGKKTENPGFFFSISPKGAGIFTGMHEFSKPRLEVYRDSVVDTKRGSELEKAIASLEKAGGYKIGGEHYKRVPKGYDPDHKRADLLRYNGLYTSFEAISKEAVLKPNLIDVCFDHCKKMAPLHKWLIKINQD